VLIAFSTRADGSMRVGSTGSEILDAQIKNNRQAFFSNLGINDKIVSPVLVHSSNIVAATSADAGKIIEKTDALITNEPGLFLSLTVSDCLPVFFYDPVQKAVGLAHAGWRGLDNGILKNTVQKFVGDYGSDPKKLIAGIGPAICKKEYQIQEDLVEKFKAYPTAIIRNDRGIFLDLAEIAKIQLQSLGIKAENIEICAECTYELPDKYFSYRRDKPEFVEPMVAVIGIKS
jgi:YfiH family protein